MIPFNRVCKVGNELDYITQALSSGRVSGDKGFTKLVEDKLAQLGSARVLLTTSCTHALEMAAVLLDIKEGDEVIVPSFTFVSTANAFVSRGARPVFCDIRRDTLNMDETKLADLITPRTRAIVPVHYAGVGCEMDEICRLARSADHPIMVIEDNAHGLLGKYKDKWLGTIGDLGTQSFHETKNITCGEGGALLINRPEYISRLETIRDNGTNRSQFMRGEIPAYSWVDQGSSYLLSDILAAMLLGQLEMAEIIQLGRHQIWNMYDRELANWMTDMKITGPYVPSHCAHAAHMYYLIMPTPTLRTSFISYMKNQGVQTVFHYSPLNRTRYGRRFGGDCPVAEDLAARLVRLPMYALLDRDTQSKVIEAALGWWGQSS